MKAKRLGNGLLAAALVTAMLHVTSCGTLMYPERRGQAAGKIDPQIAILNGIGLLFFLVPGVVAFAVDFSNGTIYLPAGGASLEVLPTDLADMVAVNVGERALNASGIEALVLEHTGRRVDLSHATVKMARGGVMAQLR